MKLIRKLFNLNKSFVFVDDITGLEVDVIGKISLLEYRISSIEQELRQIKEDNLEIHNHFRQLQQSIEAVDNRIDIVLGEMKQ